MIPRKLESIIAGLAGQYPVVVVTGPRQSGKTTLIKKVFSGKRYVNLEDPEQYERALRDPRAFLDAHKGMVIDEIQRVPQLLSYIQVMVDESGRRGQFILSGSQNMLMMQSVSQSLAGRSAIVRLLPFSLEELTGAALAPGSLNAWLFRGGFPFLYRTPDADPVEFYRNYLQTYVERDVRQVKNITDLHAFQLFIRMCAGRAGQLLNMHSLASDAGVSHATVKAWLSVLEAGYVLYPLMPHFRNFRKRLVKTPKLYFYDTGLLCFLLGIETADQLGSHYARGHIFENLIVNEFIKFRYNRSRDANGYFWRDNHGTEVDYLVDLPEAPVPVEIKAGATVNGEFFKGLAKYCGLAGIPSDKGYLVYGGDKAYKDKNGTVVGWRNLPGMLADIYG